MLYRTSRICLALLAPLSACVTQLDDGGSSAIEQLAPAPARSWRPLANRSPIGAAQSLLLTDGTVMIQEYATEHWWRLSPDASGSYERGTWSQMASMPDGYRPFYYASAVLPDGRVIVEGGEYIGGSKTWSNDGAIYDPVADTWTKVAPPHGWTRIGDAASVVLATGQLMLAACNSRDTAILDAGTLTWTATGSGKADINSEEGWTLLPSGQVLTVDANDDAHPGGSEIYTPGPDGRGSWASAGTLPVGLADNGGSHEIGGAVLRPDGTVFATGATGHNAVYDLHTGAWSPAPDFPMIAAGQLDVADGPVTLLPNGSALIAASPRIYGIDSHFFEWDGKALTEVPQPPRGSIDPSFTITLLPLPSGEILMTDLSHDVELYAPAVPGAQPEIEPQIMDAPSKIKAGHTYDLTGVRLNGISQAVGYGDDSQAATNYPLVRITHRATGHVTYARTHDHTSMAIARDQVSTTHFDVPAGIDKGASDLVVVASGLVSQPIAIDVR
jgi:hypothetical protein